MAARTLQPSEYDIQREVEALRDIRRRSSNPGALAIDPDLPNQSPPSSPTSTYWSGKSAASTSGSKDGDFPATSNDARSPVDLIGHRDDASRTSDTANPNNPADDPFHLFWVPAGLHPEIAPAEFRAFLKEHARSPPPSDDDALERSNSMSSSLSSRSSLNRKRSMLSRQYRPQENDGVEEENVVPLKRTRSRYVTHQGPPLTINDLQRLEELAEEATDSDDPSKLRSVLRRSLSLNLSPSAIEHMDEMPDMGDEADIPIIVPPPGQILRRAARTKIRKPGLPGDGGGHRFGASRRGAPSKSGTEHRTSSELSSSDHGELESAISDRRRTVSDDGYHTNGRPDSFSEEASIFDAYARDDEDEPAPVLITSPPPETSLPLPTEASSQPLPEVKPALLEALGPVIHHPQPQRLVVQQPSNDPVRMPSPSESPITPLTSYTPPTLHPTTSPSPPSHHQRKEKEKDKGKGIFGKWGGDKGGKKSAKDKERENRDRAAAEKEKEAGFFGSLFGAKKKQDAEYQSPITGGASGREAAQALLGASKSSKSYVPPTSPGLAPGVTNSFARYPLHVERAIYRLSHIKLANPRRPLYEQVLISNLMFWYLGVINKAQNPQQTSTQATTNGSPSTDTQNAEEKQEEDKERREREQRENAEKERLERERSEKEQREKEMEMKKKESGRRGSLTKTPVGGAGGRRAEMPIKGPQYEMQHRVMEQEYGGYNGQPQQGGRPPSAPAAAMNGPPGQQYPRSPQPSQYPNNPPKLVPAPQKSQYPDNYYYQSENQQQRPGLPPGAMPPGMVQSSSSPPQRRTSPPSSSHERSRSPPQQNNVYQQQQGRQQQYHNNVSQENLGMSGGHKSPGRSLSATATTSLALPSTNGNMRKGNSAHASLPQRPRTSEGNKGNGEEEDLPLSVWQQRRK